MAISLKFKDTEFGVGDKVRVTQTVKEGEKERHQYFDGTVIAIKGKGVLKTFTVRRIGVQQIGIEKIFPTSSPSLKEVSIIKKASSGVRRAKLYYIRKKTKKEIDKIYNRSLVRDAKK